MQPLTKSSVAEGLSVQGRLWSKAGWTQNARCPAYKSCDPRKVQLNLLSVPPWLCTLLECSIQTIANYHKFSSSKQYTLLSYSFCGSGVQAHPQLWVLQGYNQGIGQTVVSSGGSIRLLVEFPFLCGIDSPRFFWLDFSQLEIVLRF